MKRGKAQGGATWTGALTMIEPFTKGSSTSYPTLHNPAPAAYVISTAHRAPCLSSYSLTGVFPDVPRDRIIVRRKNLTEICVIVALDKEKNFLLLRELGSEAKPTLELCEDIQVHIIFLRSRLLVKSCFI